MRCGCYVKEIPTHGGKRVRKEVVPWFHTQDGIGRVYSALNETVATPLPAVSDLLKDGYKVCEGRIRVEIAAEDEPYMGGSSATLEVGYSCSLCDNRFWPELPAADKINEFLEGLISKIDIVGELQLRESAKEAEKKKIEFRREMLARAKALDEARKAAKVAKKKPRQ